MIQADPPSTTHARNLKSSAAPSRRVFIGAAAIGLLAGDSVAALAAVTSQNADADLLAACAAYHAAADAEQAACGGEDDLPAELVDAVYASLKEVDELSPTTIEGVRAKAGVLHRMLSSRDIYQDAEDPRSGVSDLNMAAINFLRDLSGEG